MITAGSSQGLRKTAGPQRAGLKWRMPTKRAIRWAIAVNLIVVLTAVAFWIRDSAQAATAVIQTLILGDTLWVLWLYTRATLTLATTAEDQLTPIWLPTRRPYRKSVTV
jgi:hypothetical protein